MRAQSHDVQDITPRKMGAIRVAGIYAVGDIHGQLSKLETALERIEADGGPDARIVFLGDYVDRGPDSAGVIELLSKGLSEGRNWVCILGNHDRMFSYFLEFPPRSDPFLKVGWDWFHTQLGGRQTLESYKLDLAESRRLYQIHRQAHDVIPDRHKDFLANLAPYHVEGDYLFVHAGIRPGVALKDQTENDLIWIRQEFHDDTREYPWVVVHGHTPVEQATHYGNRVNLDTGAAFGRELSVAVFESNDCHLLGADGRRSLRPEVRREVLQA